MTITATPDAGYEVDTVTVTDANGNSVSVTKVNDTTYTFTQPNSKVKIDVTFKPIQGAATTGVFAPYSDLDANEWYADGVRYVLEHGIMSGYGDGKFGPNDTTSRAMIAQILYNMEGKPAYSGMSDFTDVNANDWYAAAIRWASAEGIVGGYGNGKFGPNDELTREQLVTILYRYAKYKGVNRSFRKIAAGSWASITSTATMFALGRTEPLSRRTISQRLSIRSSAKARCRTSGCTIFGTARRQISWRWASMSCRSQSGSGTKARTLH